MAGEGREPPVVVYPWLDGARRVTIHGESVGRAYSLRDVLEFLHLAGLEENGVRLDDPELVEWRGGGPADWPEDQV
ncbi:hypothetical protein AB0C51_23655 [Streptomyces pathocidini]|uniref:hypothetical protein n=1 Tax=Streptomyces pathocidini TaxID=1650571 RepID=UPI003402424E